MTSRTANSRKGGRDPRGKAARKSPISSGAVREGGPPEYLRKRKNKEEDCRAGEAALPEKLRGALLRNHRRSDLMNPSILDLSSKG